MLRRVGETAGADGTGLRRAGEAPGPVPAVRMAEASGTSLRRVGEASATVPTVRIAEARFPSPFASGLEYSAPARGTWNIVHTGMLIPEAHQIFVCAQGCLRGVVLTAAEMNAAERFSTIAVRENNVLEGDMETLILDGVTDILSKLPKLPPAVLLYTSCIHHFMGCDLPLVYRELAERFPQVQFTDCYMNPIMRKSGLNPDQLMRRQLYSLLKPGERDPRLVHLAGNDFAYDPGSELFTLLRENGFRAGEIANCRTYDEYQALAGAAFCVTTFPAARAAGEMLEEKYGQKHIYLPFSVDYQEIRAGYARLCAALEIPLPDFAAAEAACETALAQAKAVIGDAPVYIDYTACPRPLGLARLLLDHGFRVERVYADGFTGDEAGDFAALQARSPELMLWPTVHPAMRTAPRQTEEKTLAIGQKAAYFSGSDYFVNIVEGGGHFGFDGVQRLAAEMAEAFAAPKDARALIQIKGMGCGCCQ